jgi:hypothetical protein
VATLVLEIGIVTWAQLRNDDGHSRWKGLGSSL